MKFFANQKWIQIARAIWLCLFIIALSTPPIVQGSELSGAKIITQRVMQGDEQEWMWCRSRIPLPGRRTVLDDIVALSEDDIWATGSYREHATLSSPWFLHWDGKVWRRIPSPSIGAGTYFINRISALAPDDIWAVGTFSSDDSNGGAIAMHWDGNEWDFSVLPHIPTAGLYDVAAIAPDNVWAVGQQTISNKIQPLFLHWDSAQWKIVTTPKFKSGAQLTSIHAISANDIWASGTYPKTHMLHWNGSSWQKVPNVPSLGGRDIGGVAGNDLWTVGAGTWHWDGATWSQTPVVDYVALRTVRAFASDNVWAVGEKWPGSLIAHWNSAEWQSYDKFPIQSTSSQMRSVAVASANSVWAVGVHFAKNDFKSFILHGQPPRLPARGRLISPQHYSIVTDPKVVFKWKEAICAERYELFVRTHDGRVDVNKTDLRAKHFVTDALEKGNKYNWRVRACNEMGCGEWSDFRAFIWSPP